MDRPDHGQVSPAEFVPRLEESALIVDVGNWVIATSCEQIPAPGTPASPTSAARQVDAVT